MAGKSDRIAFSTRAFHPSKEKWKRPPRLSSYVDRFSIDRPPSSSPPPPPLPRREINCSRARDRDGVMNYSNWSRPTLRDDLVASQWKRRGKRGRRIDKRRKKEWKIVIHGRYRLCPPLPPLPRFPDNLLIVLLIQEQEISSFDASNLF